MLRAAVPVSCSTGRPSSFVPPNQPYPFASVPVSLAKARKYGSVAICQSRRTRLVEPASALASQPGAGGSPVPLYALSEGLETPIQVLYLVTLLGFLAVGAFLVVRQVLIRRELDEAAKDLGERIRTGEASCEDLYELGVILTRKKLFTQATKNLEKAKKVWDGEESELAQVHNALGYCYNQMDRNELAMAEYKRAVELQPGYVTAWNNLGDVLEKVKAWRQALDAYQEALSYAPNNEVALQRASFCKQKLERMSTSSLE